MTSNGDRDIGYQELNHHVKEEFNIVHENGVEGNAHRPGSFRNGELRNDKVDEDVKDGQGQLVGGQFVVQRPQLQPQGSRDHWERFLNVRSIKVMLVENDDSTRHIVTALLRNCNYEVIEAANGLQAWKILEDLTIHVDIILTEVAMPLLSGVSLLCKIMSHNTRKNVPVIMMSSHDSMGLVFKCLSKGAVDFLVKPIRKNELKNLWQHVWRRCHSSSGSGSESGTQTQKSVKSKSSARSDKNSDSNDGDDDESNGLDTGDGSDDGSGTQSSWAKQAVEVDSPRGASQWNQKAECQDSTCGQVIRSNVEAPGTRDIHGQEQLENVAKGKELVVGELKHSRGGECSSHKHKDVGSSMPNPPKDEELEALREPTNLEIKNNISDDPNEGAVIELSLKRLREVRESDRAVQYDRNVLRHSELSAFSRYNTTAKASSDPSGIIRRSSQLNNSLDVTKKESMRDVRSRSDGYVDRVSNRVGDNMDVGSATDKLHTNPLILNDKSEVIFMNNCLHSSSAFRPIKTDIKSPSQKVGPAKTNDMTNPPNRIRDPPRDPHHELLVQHIHHHHHVHHYHDIDGVDQSLSNPDDFSVKLAADAPYCGSSNVLGGPVLDGIPGNYSLNRSASGSKYGSNGQNGSSTAVNAGGANMESLVGVAPKNENGDDSGSGSGNGIDQSKSAQREAALIKFRQKRKERCFQKKVRYQNRKKLAEQRPRVRGQFVKQTGNTDNSSSAADS